MTLPGQAGGVFTHDTPPAARLQRKKETMPEPTRGTVADALQRLIDDVHRSTIDRKLTVTEFGRITVGLIRLGILMAEPLTVPGSDKKAIVMAAVAMLFDTVADKCVPVYAYPAWLAIRLPVRALVLAAASGALEAILRIVLPDTPPEAKK